jgi:hypothetical protein
MWTVQAVASRYADCASSSVSRHEECSNKHFRGSKPNILYLLCLNFPVFDIFARKRAVYLHF